MHKGRLEAFSDGVLAIIITIMVLEMKVPHGTDFVALRGMYPVFLSYVLSFVYVGIYWANHHHLLHAVKHVTGGVLWANLHLLFWLSLFPFTTGWMGENHFATLPVVVYGSVLIMAAIAYYILVRALLAAHEDSSPLKRAIGSDFKGKISVVIYAAGIALAFINRGSAQRRMRAWPSCGSCRTGESSGCSKRKPTLAPAPSTRRSPASARWSSRSVSRAAAG